MRSTAFSETIAAIATAPGQGAIGIVRLSGPACQGILAALFRPSHPGFSGFRPRVLHHGTLLDTQGSPLDDAMAVFFPGPRTFTGEDMAELHCHGSPAVLAEALAACCASGAVYAPPGEFSRRAFLSGHLDLTQAEAVAELVAAESPEAARQAREKLEGSLGRLIRGLRQRLLDLRAQLCLAVDFPEDEVECLRPDALDTEVGAVGAEIEALCAAFDRGRMAREGALVVLAGAVNAGKSSLLNALLGRERAIVSDEPGTTRDYIEECVLLDGLKARIVDTAGLRETEDRVELMGVVRSRELLAAADLVLLVVDGSRPLGRAETQLCADLPASRLIGCVNKADLPPAENSPAAALRAMGIATVNLCAKHGQGMDALSRSCRDRLFAGSAPSDGRPAPNLRQLNALLRASGELAGLRTALAEGLPPDLLSSHLDAACAALADVTGEITPAEVLDSVFSAFCIGK